LDQALLAASDKLARFDHHAFAAAAGKRLPPHDGIMDSALVTKREPAPSRRGHDPVAGSRHAVG
jgi:hypothetical protein